MAIIFISNAFFFIFFNFIRPFFYPVIHILSFIKRLPPQKKYQLHLLSKNQKQLQNQICTQYLITTQILKRIKNVIFRLETEPLPIKPHSNLSKYNHFQNKQIKTTPNQTTQMSKIFILALCLLSLISIISAQQCTVELVSPSSPGVGSAVQAFILTPGDNYEEVSFPIAEINFSGTCACDFTLYSNANLTGAWYRAWFSKRSSRKVKVSNVWSKKALSAKVTCNF